MRQHLKRLILNFLGCALVVLGIIGVVLPVLPTTPFLILALACFAKSSPYFHQKLLNNRWFGSTLQQWENNRSISRTAKRKAMVLIILTFSISILVLSGRIALQLMLLLMCCMLLIFMKRLKEDGSG